MTSYLLDTGFLYALINRSEQRQEEVVAATTAIRGAIVLPVPAITETAYLGEVIHMLITLNPRTPDQSFDRFNLSFQ